MIQPQFIRHIVGVMSGTSLDGIDVAFVRVEYHSNESEWPYRYELVGFESVAYDADLKNELLKACSGEMRMRDMLALDADLGGLFADAIEGAANRLKMSVDDIDAVGIHGQTIWHAPDRKPHGVTTQIGSGAVLAHRLNAIVVNDFRAADVAAGGEGAPLVPFFDRMVLGSTEENRIVLNVGGIANLTWLPADSDRQTPAAFDTGPGNALIDAAMRELRGLQFDENGTLAAEGEPDESAVKEFLSDPWFTLPPPKSTGRERFSEDRGRAFALAMRQAGTSDADIMATLTLITARTIALAVRQVAGQGGPDVVIISGGGAHNRTLVRMLEAETGGVPVRPSDDYGVPGDAKEALCFAVLAHATLLGHPNTIPSVTGASRPTIGGAIRLPYRRSQL